MKSGQRLKWVTSFENVNPINSVIVAKTIYSEGLKKRTYFHHNKNITFPYHSSDIEKYSYLFISIGGKNIFPLVDLETAKKRFEMLPDGARSTEIY